VFCSELAETAEPEDMQAALTVARDRCAQLLSSA